MSDADNRNRVGTSPFVSPEALVSAVDDDRPRFIDARGRKQYDEGHLPGAVNLPAATLNPPLRGVPTLILPARLKARLDELGVGAGPVVVYGSRGGADAAHVWWTLHAYGHGAATILDGGIDAWLAAGGDTEAGGGSETSPPPADPVAFTPRLDTRAVMTRSELRQRLDDPDLAVLDTRSDAEYAGREVAARRGGHIPGARLYPWDASIDKGLRLRPRGEIQAGLAEVMRRPEAVTYCQSGVRAAHTYAVLRMLGHPRPRLYLGSWADWGNRPDTPVDAGETAPNSREGET